MSKRRQETDKIAQTLLSCDADVNNHFKPILCEFWVLKTGEMCKPSIIATLVNHFNMDEVMATKAASAAIVSGSAHCCTMPKNCADTKLMIAQKAGAISGIGYQILIKYQQAQ